MISSVLNGQVFFVATASVAMSSEHASFALYIVQLIPEILKVLRFPFLRSQYITKCFSLSFLKLLPHFMRHIVVLLVLTRQVNEGQSCS